jgi:hypothetical protein
VATIKYHAAGAFTRNTTDRDRYEKEDTFIAMHTLLFSNSCSFVEHSTLLLYNHEFSRLHLSWANVRLSQARDIACIFRLSVLALDTQPIFENIRIAFNFRFQLHQRRHLDPIN